MTRRKKWRPEVGGHVRILREVTGHVEGTAFRAQPGVVAEILEVRDDDRLVIRTNRQRGTCLVDLGDVSAATAHG